MAEINWGLARIPDFAGNAYAAQAEGQKVRDQSALKNAYATYAKDPEAGIAAIMPYDPAAATQLASGRRQEKRQDSADALAAKDRERADLQRKAELGTKVGLALKSLPPEARQGYIQQQSQFLTQSGLTPEEVAAIPLDDASIEAGIAQAMSVSDYLKKNNDDRTFAAGREDEVFDQTMETKKFGHTVQQDAIQNGLARAKLAQDGGGGGGGGGGAGGGGAGLPAGLGITDLGGGFYQDKVGRIYQRNKSGKLEQTVGITDGAVAAGVKNATGLNNVMSALDRFRGTTKNLSAKDFGPLGKYAGDPEKYASAKAAATDLMMLLKSPEVYNLGVITGPDMAILEGVVADPAKFDSVIRKGQIAPQLNQLEKTLRSKYDGERAAFETLGGRGDALPRYTAPVAKPPAELGARQGAGGKFYAPDPNRPKSFPEVALGADGVWRMKSANGQILKFVQ